MRYFIQFALLLLLIQGVSAQSIDAKEFFSTEQEQRYQNLIDEIRCPVCQGQSIGGSNASLALDLRERVGQLIINGKTDDEIHAFMVERYGDFVVFKPPVKASTYVLWFTPFVFLLICLMLLFRATKSKTVQTSEAVVDLEKAKNLLK
ncbi:MAG: cytochrome c-type biogenesis protein CcmH [Gammaproteobacteria bacterium]|nr:cytochrome c-type biogenesis protein CcmH [Gammaproteobacteria bacterium]